jgi:hypothetical protein
MTNVGKPVIPTPEEVCDAASRIAETQAFKGSTSVRSLLLFLARHGKEQPGQPVKEYELATLALGLDQSYDSRIDSQVRVVAGRLRAKLAEYNTHDGAADRLVLDLPKGSYLLQAVYRENTNGNGLPMVAAVPRSAVLRRRALLGTAVAAAAGAGFLAGRWRPTPEVASSSRTFWSLFGGQGADVLIVFSNPRLLGTPETGMRYGGKAESPGNGSPVIDIYTGTGEVMAVRALTRQMDALGIRSQAKRALLFTWDQARSNDLVFLGGPVQNSPLEQFRRLEKLNFKAPGDAPVSPLSAVRNEKPQAGEEAFYYCSSPWTDGSEYGIIALLPGGSQERKALLLAGASTLGTEAAADFVCSPARLAELLARMNVTPGGRVPYFEALVKVDVRGGAPAEPRLVLTHRRSDAA